MKLMTDILDDAGDRIDQGRCLYQGNKLAGFYRGENLNKDGYLEVAVEQVPGENRRDGKVDFYSIDHFLRTFSLVPEDIQQAQADDYFRDNCPWTQPHKSANGSDKSTTASQRRLVEVLIAMCHLDGWSQSSGPISDLVSKALTQHSTDSDVEMAAAALGVLSKRRSLDAEIPF